MLTLLPWWFVVRRSTLGKSITQYCHQRKIYAAAYRFAIDLITSKTSVRFSCIVRLPAAIAALTFFSNRSSSSSVSLRYFAIRQASYQALVVITCNRRLARWTARALSWSVHWVSHSSEPTIGWKFPRRCRSIWINVTYVRLREGG